MNLIDQWLPDTYTDPIDVAYSREIRGVCIDAEEYARTALPDWIWKAAEKLFIHCGLFAEHKLQALIPDIFSHNEITSPHPNLQERFFAIANDALISNVIGRTRLIHNLMLLRLLGVQKERLCVIEEQTDFIAEYEFALKAIASGHVIDRVVLCFNGESIVRVWRDMFKHQCEIARLSSPLLKAILISACARSTLLVHLTSVYGTQVVPFVNVLRESFGLQEVLIFGACGGLNSEICLHDTVFVQRVLDESGQVLIEGNQLLPLASKYFNGLTGFHRSRVADVSSVLCIPAETRGGMESLARNGANAIDLEMSPLARYLSRHKSLSWGAALHVSDHPLIPKEQLGTIPLLDIATKARQNETFNQARIAADIWPSSIHRQTHQSNISWKLVSGDHPLSVLETIVEGRDGQAITVHAAPIQLDKLTLAPAVNALGQGYVWKDGIVRGIVPWDQEHMIHMNQHLRKSPREYLGELEASESVVAILNGNGNLYWNLGHFVFVKGKLYHHFREHLCGPQTVLLQDANGCRLATLGVDALSQKVDFAVSGCRIIHQGEPVDILSIDHETGRPVISEFYGDMTHVLHGFGLGRSLARRVFTESSQLVNWEGRSYYAKGDRSSAMLADAACGHPITCVLSSDDNIGPIRDSLNRYGYSECRWGERLTSGTFAFHKDNVLALAYRRATLGHSVIASTTDPNVLLLINTYTNQNRKGFTLEDTARLVLQSAASLSHCVKDALVISSSGDPRIILRRSENFFCLQNNSQGELLLFKGGVDYGLTSILMVTERS